MGSFGSFYKGDKKKPKKGKQKNVSFTNPTVITMPEIITKKEKNNS